LLENVRGLASSKFQSYRQNIQEKLLGMGYWSEWQILNASDFGVPQLRPRFILVAIKKHLKNLFKWPKPNPDKLTVGEALN